MQREVKPEILDELNPWDPRAIRSRADLRRINRLMGNHRWICRELAQLHRQGLPQAIELGAGDGQLAARLLEVHPELRVTAIDLQAPDPSLAEHPRLTWIQGDVLDLQIDCSRAVVISNLFLHHLEADALQHLGHRLQSAAALLACEPERRPLHLFQAKLGTPLFNAVTHHDMVVSIEAGFRGRELIEHLSLPASWRWQQNRNWLGAHRVKGVRS